MERTSAIAVAVLVPALLWAAAAGQEPTAIETAPILSATAEPAAARPAVADTAPAAVR